MEKDFGAGQLVQPHPKPVDAKVSGKEAKGPSNQAKTLDHGEDPAKIAADNGFRVGCYCKFTEKQLKGLDQFQDKIWLLKELRGNDAMFVEYRVLEDSDAAGALELPLKSLEKVNLYQNQH